MAAMKCPGPQRRNVRPDQVQEVECPACGKTVEMWPDEPSPGEAPPAGEGRAGTCPHCKKPLPGE